jgi:hypothetical protein
MIIATSQDTDRVISIFQEAFKDNPHILFLLGTRRLKQKIAIMTKHVVKVALKRGGLYLSEDRQGVLIVFDAARLPLSFTEKLEQYWMALRCFQLHQLRTIARTEKLAAQRRVQQHGDLYVWFYAVSEEGLGGKTARSLLSDLFDLARQKNAAILAETSIARNMVIYKRYGFETYDQVQFETFPIFYMRRAAQAQE